MAELKESLDFDFFETPRSPVEEKHTSPVDRPKTSTRPQSAKPPIQDRNRRRSPLSDSSRDNSTDRSLSDLSVSEDSVKGSNKGSQARKSPSLSSLSSSDRSRSRSRSASKAERSRSASNDSRDSQKYSDSFHSDSEVSSPRFKEKQQNEMSRKCRSQQEEDDNSSSAYSDDDYKNSVNIQKSGSHRNNKPYRNRPKSAGKRQAWGTESYPKTSVSTSTPQRTRPTTAKTRNSPSNIDRRGSQRSYSDASSDSDMTDVSPIESPRREHVGGGREHVGGGDNDGSRFKFRAMPVTDTDLHDENREYGDHHNKGALDLEILMKAVGELEKQKRLKANSRRVMFAPMSLKRGEKANYTFDKNQTRDIERENQRLLNEIVHQVRTSERKQHHSKSAPVSAYKLTASAINRDREMKRIESENMALLKRLQKVKPTKTLARDNQLHSYENTKLHGIPIGNLHPMPRKTSSRARRPIFDDTSSLGSRTRSMTSINSAMSSVRSRPNSRPGSATKRADTRPMWSDRW